MRRHRCRGVFFLLLALLLAEGGSSGCRRRMETSSATPSTGEAQPGAAAPASSDPQERDRAQVKSRFADLKKALSRSSAGADQKISAGRSFIGYAQQIAAKYKIDLAELNEARGLVKKLEEDVARKAESDLAGLQGQVDKLLDDPSPDPRKFDRARKLLVEFKQEAERRQPGSDLRPRLKELDEKIGRHELADVAYANRLAKIKAWGDDHARIIGYLEGFDPDYDDTPYGEKIKKLISEHYVPYTEQQAQKKTAQSEPVYSELNVASAYEVWGGPEGTEVPVENKKGILTLGPNPGDYAEKDEQGTFIAIGDGSWIDVHLNFDARIEDPENVFFGAKGRKDGRGVPSFRPRSLKGLNVEAAAKKESGEETAGGDKEKKEEKEEKEEKGEEKEGARKKKGKSAGEEEDAGTWLKFVVIIEGSNFQIDCPDLNWNIKGGGLLADDPGYFVLQVRGEKAKIAIRNFQVAVLKQDKSVLQKDSEEEKKKTGGTKKGGTKKGTTKGKPTEK
ncbi:MAG: hypothetical protein HY717_24255 [Planctomycetes bacterium]|nr:hypothetical protein [Planctomycetota bacterium]